MRATVCLPTYNERENLEPMVRALGEVLGAGGRVLVIDDNSPDGTGEIADRLAERAAVRRRPSPRGARRASGPRTSTASGTRSPSGAELVLEMDCDFSHDPAAVPRPDRGRPSEADLVLGSRYVPGGSVGNWGRGPAVRLRRAARGTRARLLGVPVRDLTGGFKCYRRARARGDRPRRDPLEGLRLPDRDDLPRAAQGLPRRRGADLVRRPRGRAARR